MTLDQFLELLEGVRKQGAGYIARCPAHEDREASLSVYDSDDKIGLTCHAGCDNADIVTALGITWSDLWYKPKGRDLGEPEKVYDYVDEEGQLLFQAVRYPGKVFRQRHLDPDDGWVNNLDGVRRVLYRLPEVLAAIAEGRAVYLVEGEKDVETLRALGRTATCNPMGAGKWRPEYSESLRGATVVIIADRDEPGRNHAQNVKDALIGIAAAVHVFQSAKGKDVTDHFDAGLDFPDLQPVRQRVSRGVLTARELAAHAREYLTMKPEDIPGYEIIPGVPLKMRQGRMYAIGGYTGDGKSTLVQTATRGWCEGGAHVTYVTLEMPERDIINCMIAHKGIPLSLLEEPWNLNGSLPAYREAVDELESWNLDVVFEQSGLNADRITEIAVERECAIMVVDHIHRLGWGGERRSFESEVQKLTNLAIEQNIVLVLLCQLREPRLMGKDIVLYPRPTLQSFRETGVIGQDSSMSMAIWRARDDQGIKFIDQPAELILLKNRHPYGRKDATGQNWFLNYDLDHRKLVMSGSETPTQEEESW